jgi:hypothetical protein
MNIYEDRKIISLNSQHGVSRDNNGSANTLYEKTFLSHIDYPFKDILRDDPDTLYSTVEIESASIPKAWYLINYTTNILKYQMDGRPALTLTLERGNYDLNSLLFEIKSKFLEAGFTFIITFNKVTGKLKFSNATRQFKFLSASSGSTISEIIGFDSVLSYSSSIVGGTNVLDADHPVSLIGYKLIKVSSVALHTNSLSSGQINGDALLGVIPVNAGPFDLIQYKNTTGRGGILRNRQINAIDIILTDENGRYINLNNTEYNIVICITSYKVLKPREYSTFRQLLQPSQQSQTLQSQALPQGQQEPVKSVLNENDLSFLTG